MTLLPKVFVTLLSVAYIYLIALFLRADSSIIKMPKSRELTVFVFFLTWNDYWTPQGQAQRYRLSEYPELLALPLLTNLKTMGSLNLFLVQEDHTSLTEFKDNSILITNYHRI